MTSIETVLGVNAGTDDAGQNAVTLTKSTEFPTDPPGAGCRIKRGVDAVALSDLACSSASTLYPPSPRLGVVIGTFGAVPYVHLQLEARKRLYPHIPVLVHDDCSDSTEELRAICETYGADFETNDRRCGAQKGDLTVFIGGLLWAQRNDFDVLVKISRRFVPLVDWTTPLLKLAIESQYPTFASWTTSWGFGFRSECVGLAVSEWCGRGFVAEMAHRVLQPDDFLVECVVHDLARRAAIFRCQAAHAYDARVGLRPRDRDGYAVWPFVGTDRNARSETFLWHNWAGPQEYWGLGRGWGLPYGFDAYARPGENTG